MAVVAGCRDLPQEIPQLPKPTAALSFEGDEPIRFGELRRARVTVFNTSLKAILLRSVSLEEQLPFCHDLMSALSGQLREKRAFKYFTYNSRVGGRTPRVFADDLLLFPGEKTVFEDVTLRTRFFVQGITIWYQNLPLRTLTRQVYFPERNPHRRRELRYRLMPATAHAAYRRAETGTLERTVVVPDPDALGPLLSNRLDLRVPIEDFAEPGEAIARAGASTASTITRWVSEDLWIIDDPRSEMTFAVSDTRRVPLPRSDLKVFDLFDRAQRERLGGIDATGQRFYLSSGEEIWKLLEASLEASHSLEVESMEDSAGQLESLFRVTPAATAKEQRPELAPATFSR